ncbi:hypothetical protein [Kerstersia gyiorum]|uniref:hypothetical protein n=1 Tax=Kerstersia gyiorum TaxID=206506 RepID=UPI00209F0991|nr:hypothetical protein [Kerstersia gyiorum]MCP1679428.1 hypothetical protein [Kerstersia gyiorum]MCP1823931.1 hypothetical protein [Kerstersia gyiorum]MCP1827372.1 hypothetical protein [Kerstersia gyiorum]MCW2448979.1 hypothetical protein [Kerstersia gyiorum]
MTTEPTSVTAGRLCRQPSFQAFLGVSDEPGAAKVLRKHCGIDSRRELDFNKDSAALFHELRKRFAYGDAA